MIAIVRDCKWRFSTTTFSTPTQLQVWECADIFYWFLHIISFAHTFLLAIAQKFPHPHLSANKNVLTYSQFAWQVSKCQIFCHSQWQRMFGNWRYQNDIQNFARVKNTILHGSVKIVLKLRYCCYFIGFNSPHVSARLQICDSCYPVQKLI